MTESITTAHARILVVDDEPSMREVLSIFLRRKGYDVQLVPGYGAALDAIRNSPEPYAVVLTDLMMPDGSGLDLLTEIRSRGESTEIIVMTAHSSIETALEAMRRGAYDFIQKPFTNAELKALLDKALEKRALSRENEQLKARIDREQPVQGLLGHSPPMKALVDMIQRVAPSKSTVLITGESGTGKERVARSVHDASDRRDAPFLVVNCGAFPESLIEAELFGYEKGSFTGATHRHAGIFREAEGGTVLLDEIGELPLPMQVKLLRVLQERKVRGIGESHETPIDVRVLAATNKDVESEVQAGRFRKDLYYRLNVIRLEVPPLRERREDIPELLLHFLKRSSKELGKDVRSFSSDALRALADHPFHGNVRELENLVERAVALAVGHQVGLGDLPRELAGTTANATPALTTLGEDGCKLDEVVAEVERRLILQALERTGGVRTAAAKLLGITFRSFRYRLQKLGLASEDDEPLTASSSAIEAMPPADDAPTSERPR
ncbi:MAG: sigma-54 dependent transcriptional regulator [Polyangiaceae bacterium]